MNKNCLGCSCTHKWSLLGSVSKLFMAFEMSYFTFPATVHYLFVFVTSVRIHQYLKTPQVVLVLIFSSIHQNQSD